jgi:GntR family transcriptional regulator
MRRDDSPEERPLYRQVADDLRDAIAAGRLPPGRLLPSEPRLAREARVSLDVVRQALATLRAEGLIVTSQGKGSRVREAPETTVMPVPPGAVITCRMPTPEERERLGEAEGRVIPEGVPVLALRRGESVELLPGDRFAVETVGSDREPRDD